VAKLDGHVDLLAPPSTFAGAAYNAAIPMGWWGGAPAFNPPASIILELVNESVSERKAQSDDLRDLIGNPFRPVAFAPSWLSHPWRTSTVAALADAIYTEQAFDRLPVLADALEEAGCDNADVLSHCRGPGPHVPGCWVVDMVLCKS
jgi:hypothetical protein